MRIPLPVCLVLAGALSGGSIYIGKAVSSTNAPWCGI